MRRAPLTESPPPAASPQDTAGDVQVQADLLQRVALHGDRAAFGQLFAYFAPRVKGYLLRLGAANAQAEEMTQEVMVAVWRKAASFDPAQGSAATWIFRIARNRRIDAFRQERRALDPDEPLLRPAPEAAPDARVEAGEREARVRKALAELPAEQRRLVREAFYEDLSHSQIAAKTGVPLGTIKSRLRLAMAKLRQILDGEAS